MPISTAFRGVSLVFVICAILGLIVSQFFSGDTQQKTITTGGDLGEGQRSPSHNETVRRIAPRKEPNQLQVFTGPPAIVAEKRAVYQLIHERGGGLAGWTAQEVLVDIGDREPDFQDASEPRDRAERIEGAAEVLLDEYVLTGKKWPLQVQQLVHKKIVEYAVRAGEIYGRLGDLSTEALLYERVESVSLADPVIMKRHSQILSDKRLTTFQVATGAIALGICHWDHHEEDTAARIWSRGIELTNKHAFELSNQQITLMRLLGDTYCARKQFVKEEKYRRMAVQTGLRLFSPMDAREDALAWQRSLVSIGKLKKAKAVADCLSSKDWELRLIYHSSH